MSTIETLTDEDRKQLLSFGDYGEYAVALIDQLTANRDEWQQHLLWAIDRANSEEDLARQAEAFERARAEAAAREVARLTTQVQDLEARIAKALEWTDCESLNAEAMAYHVAEELRGVK